MARIIRDPRCSHVRSIGRVSHPTDVGLASTYVCNRPDCIEDAKRWVRQMTHAEPVFVEFTR